MYSILELSQFAFDQKGDDLIQLCTEGDEAGVRAAIEDGVDINYIDPEYYDTPLSQAALKGHMSIVMQIFSKEVSVFSKDIALIFAAQSGHTEIVRYLLEKGADPNAYHVQEYAPPLYQTIVHNRMGAFKLLLQQEKLTLDMPMCGELAVDLARKHKRAEMEKMLVQRRAEPVVHGAEEKVAEALAQVAVVPSAHIAPGSGAPFGFLPAVRAGVAEPENPAVSQQFSAAS